MQQILQAHSASRSAEAAADLVALGGSGEPVGDEDRGAPPGELVEGGQHFGLGHAVQAAGGFIAQQDAGPAAPAGASVCRRPGTFWCLLRSLCSGACWTPWSAPG